MFDFLAHLFFSLSAVFSSLFIVVDVRRQKLTFYRRGYSCVSFDVSTSAFGVGEVEDLFRHQEVGLRSVRALVSICLLIRFSLVVFLEG